MTEQPPASDHTAPHVVSPGLYVSVFLTLLALTFISVWAAGHDFGPFNTVVALTIAAIKALLVITFFMHVRWSGKLVVLVVASGFVWLGFLLLFTFSDYISRGWSLVAG
jgi:cytochrome c oxidase subunit IV